MFSRVCCSQQAAEPRVTRFQPAPASLSRFECEGGRREKRSPRRDLRRRAHRSQQGVVSKPTRGKADVIPKGWLLLLHSPEGWEEICSLSHPPPFLFPPTGTGRQVVPHHRCWGSPRELTCHVVVEPPNLNSLARHQVQVLPVPWAWEQEGLFSLDGRIPLCPCH